MVVRRVRIDDRLLNENCPICLENFSVDDEIRELPCRHYFHKKDIDIWLVKNRSCPLCKLDVLKATGFQLNNNDNRNNSDSRRRNNNNSNNHRQSNNDLQPINRHHMSTIQTRTSLASSDSESLIIDRNVLMPIDQTRSTDSKQSPKTDKHTRIDNSIQINQIATTTRAICEESASASESIRKEFRNKKTQTEIRLIDGML